MTSLALSELKRVGCASAAAFAAGLLAGVVVLTAPIASSQAHRYLALDKYVAIRVVRRGSSSLIWVSTRLGRTFLVRARLVGLTTYLSAAAGISAALCVLWGFAFEGQRTSSPRRW